MKKKRGAIIFAAITILFFGSIFYRNITTYYSMKNHPGYIYGTIVKVWDDDGSWYTRYRYAVDGKVFQGRQGERHNMTDTVLIIYDTTKPRFSMIVRYPRNIELDSNNKIIRLDTTVISFKWSDYLPGDEIHSIKDLWSLD